MNKSGYTARRMIIKILVIVLIIGSVGIPLYRSWAHARARDNAVTIIENCCQVEGAKDQYFLEHSKPYSTRPTFADLTPYLKAGSRLVNDGGNDLFGNPFFIGSGGVYINPKTMDALKSGTDADFWSRYGAYSLRTLFGAVDRNDLALFKELIAEGKHHETTGGGVDFSSHPRPNGNGQGADCQRSRREREGRGGREWKNGP